MSNTLTLKLTRPAKRFGGDRYEYGAKETNDLMVVYVPQVISRNEAGKLAPIMEVTFNPQGN